MQFDNFEPKKIENFKGNYSINSLAFHETISAAITKDGSIIFWESHKLSSSKDKNINDNIRNFEVLTKNTKIK